MANTKIDFNDSLLKLKDTGQTFSTGSLYAFSNIELEPADKAAFEAAWPHIPVERRRRAVAAMIELAEEDIELSFNCIFQFTMDDPDPQVRGKSIEGLWEDESREVLTKLLKVLAEDQDDFVREKAALGLARFAYLAETGKLKERFAQRLQAGLLAQCTPEIRPVSVGRRAVEALGYFSQNEQIQKIIEKAYASDDELLKASALKAMGRSVNKRWLPEVGKELSSREPSLRYEAAMAAGEMGSDELLQPLINLTNDWDKEVQLASVWALGQIGGQEARRFLKELAEGDNEALAQAARDALAEINFNSNALNVLGN